MYDINIQAVSELLSLEFYRFKRYRIPITLVLVETEDRSFYEVVESKVRKTDIFQQIDKNLYAIIYSHTDAVGSSMAVDNILETLKTEDNHRKIVIEEALSDDLDERDVVLRSFNALLHFEG